MVMVAAAMVVVAVMTMVAVVQVVAVVQAVAVVAEVAVVSAASAVVALVSATTHQRGMTWEVPATLVTVTVLSLLALLAEEALA